MKLIVGLGNPGKEHENTRHNAGFMALDAFYAAHRDEFSPWTKKFNAEISEGRLSLDNDREEKIILMKPLTFMNLSGDAVAPARGFYKLEPADIIAVYDEADIPLGTLRIRNDGSAGGHNGIKSLIAALGTTVFPRIRIGIGAEEEARKPREDFVMQQFSTAEQEPLANALQRTTQALDTILNEGITSAMNKYNGNETP